MIDISTNSRLPTQPIAPNQAISDQWPINKSALIELLGVAGAKEMLTYLPIFFEASTPQVERLLQAAEQLDGQEMALAAHTLRGSSANLAMTSLTTLCRQIETACRQGHLQQAAAQAKQLQVEYNRIQQAYQ